MTPARYMKMQFAIATCSIFSFLANFFDFRIPYISSTIQSMFSNYTGTYFVPEFTGFSTRIFSTFDNPNYYAFVLMIVILVCFNQIQFQITFKNYALATYYGAILIMNLIALQFTGTRTVVIALAFGMIVIMLIQKKYRQIKFICLGVLFLLFILFLRPDLAPRFQDISRDFETRYDIWGNAVRFIKANPFFGKGLFTYFHTANQVGIDPEMHSHSLFIEPLLSFGIVGTGLLCAAIATEVVKIRQNASYLDTPLALGVIAATLAYGILDIPILGIQTAILTIAVLCLPLRKRVMADL